MTDSPSTILMGTVSATSRQPDCNLIGNDVTSPLTTNTQHHSLLSLSRAIMFLNTFLRFCCIFSFAFDFVCFYCFCYLTYDSIDVD